MGEDRLPILIIDEGTNEKEVTLSLNLPLSKFSIISMFLKMFKEKIIELSSMDDFNL